MNLIRTNGINIYYEIHGQGEPLVLLEGIGGNHNDWAPHLDELTKYFRCLIFDNRGMGKTSQPESEYTTRIYADDTAKLMDAVGFTSAHVVGLSMGACIAQELCLAYPEKVRSMVLVSGWARPDNFFIELINLWIQMAEQGMTEVMWSEILLWSFSPTLYKEHPQEIQNMKDGLSQAGISLKSFVRQARSLITHDTLDRLVQVKAPTLVLVGSEDIFTPYRLAEELHRAIPGSQLEVLEGEAHAFPLEHPQLLDQIVIRFTQNLQNT